jgi:hypothetical protein
MSPRYEDEEKLKQFDIDKVPPKYPCRPPDMYITTTFNALRYSESVHATLNIIILRLVVVPIAILNQPLDITSSNKASNIFV